MTLRVCCSYLICFEDQRHLHQCSTAAALSITKLYRSSRKTSKRAYNTGYGTACQDLLTFIQQGVSAGGVVASTSSQDVEGDGMTIGRVMDWIEGRLDAIRTTEEEEDEDEEKEKDKERPAAASVQPTATRAPAATLATPSSKKSHAHRSKDVVCFILFSFRIIVPTLLKAPSNQTSGHSAEHSSSSPSPPPSTSTTAIAPKPPKTRTVPPLLPPSSTTATPQSFRSETFPPPNDTPIVINAGTKRRHAMMMMLDASSPPLSLTHGPGSGPSSVVSSPGGTPSAGMGMGAGAGRRRSRTSRNLGQNQNLSVLQMASEAMDVEEDGRERKRVSRR